MTDRTPNTAINVATSSAVKCITWNRKDKKYSVDLHVPSELVDH